MIDFEHDGIYISPEGYFRSKWNSKKRKYESYSLKTDEIIISLNTEVFLTDNVRLKDIFVPLMDEPIFEIIFHTDWWKDLMTEIKSKEWKPWIGDQKLKTNIDGDEIEYLEIYKVLEFSKKEQSFYHSSIWHFHGVGYPFIDATNAQASYLKVGDSQNYALEFTSMADLMNTPFRIGNVDLYNEDEEDYKKRKIVSNSNNSLTLYELIRSVVFEMSFCGVGESLEEFKENLNSTYEEYKADSTTAVSYSSTQLDTLFEDLKIQGQEEQAIKLINKLNSIFSEIDNTELLEKMKNLLKTKISL